MKLIDNAPPTAKPDDSFSWYVTTFERLHRTLLKKK